MAKKTTTKKLIEALLHDADNHGSIPTAEFEHIVTHGFREHHSQLLRVEGSRDGIRVP